MTNEIETVWFHNDIRVDHIDSMNSELFIGEYRRKAYYGETAWSDAERDAYDLSIERMYRK